MGSAAGLGTNLSSTQQGAQLLATPLSHPNCSTLCSANAFRGEGCPTLRTPEHMVLSLE